VRHVCQDASRYSIIIPMEKLPGTFPSDPALEYDSAMKDGRIVRSAKGPDANVLVIPASFSLETRW
jgi:hypothetical protein